MNENHFTFFNKRPENSEKNPILTVFKTRFIRFLLFCCVSLYGANVNAQACHSCTGVVNEGLFCLSQLPPGTSLIDISGCPPTTVIFTGTDVGGVPDVITGGTGYSGSAQVIERTYVVDQDGDPVTTGDQTMCSHFLTIESTAMSISCQADITVTLESGECGKQVFFDLPGRGGACGSTVVNQDAANPINAETGAFYQSGDIFPQGETTLTFVATTSAYADVAPITCDLVITVEGNPGANGTMLCGDFNGSLGVECEHLVTPGDVLEGNGYGCFDNYVVSVHLTEDGPAIPGSPLITSELVDQTVVIMVTDPATGNACWNEVLIEDKLGPEICCADYELTCVDSTTPGQAQARKTYDATSAAITDGATTDFEIIMADSCYNIEGLDVRLDISHANIADLQAVLISPNLTQVTLFDLTGSTCATTDIVADFDDAATNTNATFVGTCNATAPAIGDDSYNAASALSAFNGQASHGTWILRITDAAGNPAGTLNAASIIVDADFETPVVTDNCETGITPTYVDSSPTTSCTNEFFQTFTRTWTATDSKGNTAVCTQTISVTRPSLDDLVCPAQYDGIDDNEPVFSCSATYATDANGHPAPSVTGEPTINGLSVNNICMFDSEYTDSAPQEICEGSYSIYRTWVVYDWCNSPDFVNCYQVIKVMDTTGPSITCPANATVNAGNYCENNYIVPVPSMTDVCSPTGITYTVASSSGIVETFGSGYIVNGLELGEHTITYTATDGCDNTSTCSFTVEVVDNAAPIVPCQTYTTVGLSADGSEVSWENFINNVTDNCELDEVLVKRSYDCDGAICTTCTFSETVPFYCCDIGDTVSVVVQATDIAGNVNSCTVFAIVQDNVAPVLTCPGHKEVHCDNLTELGVYDGVTIDGNGIPDVPAPGPLTYVVELNDEADLTDNDTTFVGYYNNVVDNCETSVYIWTTGSIDECGNSVDANGDLLTLQRYHVAVDQSGTTSATCIQEIKVFNPTPFDITTDVTFPNDYTSPGVTCKASRLPADLPAGFQSPTFTTTAGCDNVASGYQDSNPLYPSVPTTDYCYKIIRTWTVIDWCNNTSREEEQIIMVVDPGPDFLGCPAGGAVDVNVGGNLLLALSANDYCSGNVAAISYTVDLNNDGTEDGISGSNGSIGQTVGDGTNFPVGTHKITFTAVGECNVNSTCEVIVNVLLDCNVFSSFLDPSYALNVGGGTGTFNANDPQLYTGLSVPVSGVTITMPDNVSAATFTCADLNKAIAPAATLVNVVFHIPTGGTVIDCPIALNITDSSSPQATCQTSPATLIVSEDGLGGDVAVNLTAAMLDNGSSDNNNCTGVSDLTYSFSPAFVDCSYIIAPATSATVPVVMTVMDEYGNFDTCPTTIMISSSGAATPCSTPPPAFATVNGNIANEESDMLENVTVSPASGMNVVLTGEDGGFQFDLPLSNNYDIAPEKDDDHLNGVSTFDLVLMSKHILNVDLLDSPYKIIAADVNKSGGITTIDMVELRKMILFIDDEFPNNTSWRFVEGTHVFPDPTNPFAGTFPETYAINGLTADMNDLDFVAVKTGDVNGSATMSGFAGDADGRDFNGVLQLEMNDAQLVAGETHTIEVKANDFNNMLGYQFTLAFDGLELVDVLPGVLPGLTEANFGLQRLQEGVITTSWNNDTALSLEDGEVLFSLVIKATSTVTLSDVLNASSRYTAAEAYTDAAGSIELFDVNLAFRNEGGVQAANQFELYQNRPNPFKNETVIGFDLPQSGSATVSVYDLSGRVLMQIETTYEKGYNEVSINRSDLPSTGVLYYELTTESNSAVKKMTIIE